MRETGVFLLYLSTGLILGAILTYPLVSAGWVDHDPQHVMGRLAQVFILLGLWPFLKAMGLNDRRALGYGVSSSQFLNALWRGWLLGVSILLVLVLSLLLLGIRVPDVAGGDWLVGLAEKSLLALIGGLLISLLEESFFRGAVYSAIRRNGGGGLCDPLVVVSFRVASLHETPRTARWCGFRLGWYLANGAPRLRRRLSVEACGLHGRPVSGWRLPGCRARAHWPNRLVHGSARRLDLRYPGEPLPDRRQSCISLRMARRELRRNDRLALRGLDRPAGAWPLVVRALRGARSCLWSSRTQPKMTGYCASSPGMGDRRGGMAELGLGRCCPDRT